jgi:hypothetical protein
VPLIAQILGPDESSTLISGKEQEASYNSSEQEDVMEMALTPRKVVSLAGKKQEKTCDMEAPSSRSLSAQEQRRHRMPSSVMPSCKLPPVDGETNIPKLRAAIRGLALCLGADLNFRFDPAYYIKVLEGARGQLFVKLEYILRNQKHQPTWASLIESLTHKPDRQALASSPVRQPSS